MDENKTVSPQKAIRQFCLDCCGGSSSEVKSCTAAKCALYPFRFGKNPFRAKRELSDEHRNKLPKFNNDGKMVFNWFEWRRDSTKEYPKIHPTQKPIGLLKRLIEVFTDPGDVVIDPVAGSGSTLRAAYEMGRNSYGFEVDKNFYIAAKEKMLEPILNSDSECA